MELGFRILIVFTLVFNTIRLYSDCGSCKDQMVDITIKLNKLKVKDIFNDLKKGEDEKIEESKKKKEIFSEGKKSKKKDTKGEEGPKEEDELYLILQNTKDAKYPARVNAQIIHYCKTALFRFVNTGDYPNLKGLILLKVEDEDIDGNKKVTYHGFITDTFNDEYGNKVIPGATTVSFTSVKLFMQSKDSSTVFELNPDCEGLFYSIYNNDNNRLFKIGGSNICVLTGIEKDNVFELGKQIEDGSLEDAGESITIKVSKSMIEKKKN